MSNFLKEREERLFLESTKSLSNDLMYDRMPTAAESAICIARRRIVSAICAVGGTFVVGTSGKIVAPSSESSNEEVILYLINQKFNYAPKALIF